MGERKVLNKYIPADFDPSLIPRGKKLSSKDGTVPVRMMIPFSMKCETCHTFLYRGRKYNSKKEPVQGPEGRYLGIQRFRFYIKCQHCSRTITFTTDPKHADYEMESGASRNFELHRNTKKEQDDNPAATTTTTVPHAGGEPPPDETATTTTTAIPTTLDPVKALEHRILDSQREMAELDNLEEIKAMNARHLKIDPLQVLQKQQLEQDQLLETATTTNDYAPLTEEDEALVQSIQFGTTTTQNSQSMIRRLTEEDEARLDQQRNQRLLLVQQQQQQQAAQGKQEKKQLLPLTIIKPVKKKKRQQENDATVVVDETELKKTKTELRATTFPSNTEDSTIDNCGGGALSSLLGGYGSDDSD